MGRRQEYNFQQAESQACSLKMAKRLKELGIPQESYFYWFPLGEDHQEVFQSSNAKVNHYVRPFFYRDLIPDLSKFTLDGHIEKYEKYSAFNSLELGHMLPSAILIDETWYFYHQTKNNSNGCNIKYVSHNEDTIAQGLGNEINARASILITLLESKYIEVKRLFSKNEKQKDKT